MEDDQIILPRTRMRQTNNIVRIYYTIANHTWAKSKFNTKKSSI